MFYRLKDMDLNKNYFFYTVNRQKPLSLYRTNTNLHKII